ncbi:MAG: oligoendopeptidase F [Cellulosilyticaceae bacterium]
MPQHILPKRSDVKTEDTWELEALFESDAVFEETYKNVKKELDIFPQYQNKVTSNGQTLLKVLDLQSDILTKTEKLYVYAHMRLHQDGTNSFYQDLAARSENLAILASSTLSFISPELSNLTPEAVDVLLSENNELILYKRYLNEVLRQKEHILTKEKEEMLSQFAEIGGAPSNIFAMFNNADIKFPVVNNADGEEVQLTHARFIQLLESKDPRVRENTFKAMYGTYESFKNTLATTFAANVKQYNLFSKLRHFSSPLASALNENNIPLEVYDNLIETVHENLGSLHDYMDLRKDLLGLDTLHMYDLFVPLVPAFEKKISFDQACETILLALAPLGCDYVAIVKEAFENRWVDKYENIGKRSGAYSWGTYDAAHPYVLMNYVDNVSNMFTLAHEMGHAMHSYLSTKKQPFIYAGYCTFVAEVASTVNEALLMQYLLKTTTDPHYRKYLVNYFMEQFRSTLYRQTMFAEFEKEMHLMVSKGETLTPDVLCEHYYALVKTYHGDNMCVDAEIAMEWARIPHFYTPFYVYQYATGYSAAIALSEKILSEGSVAVAAYKEFLSGGASSDPIDLLKIAGVDMSSSKPIESALKVFASLIEEMKTL